MLPTNQSSVPVDETLQGQLQELYEHELSLPVHASSTKAVAQPSQVQAATELVVRVERKQGRMSQVLETLATHRCRVLATCSYADWSGATLLLVCENTELAEMVLDGAGFKYRTDDIVLVEVAQRFGTVARLAARLAAAGVVVVYSYISASDGAPCHAVFKTLDNAHALDILRSAVKELAEADAAAVAHQALQAAHNHASSRYQRPID